MTEHVRIDRPFTGWHFFLVIAGFFAVTIGVNVYMAVEAVRTWTGVVVEDSYASGIDFNERVQLAREQEALGWHGGLSYAGGVIRLAMLDAQNQPLAIADVTVAVTRPIGDAHDHTLTLVRGADGSYSAPVDLSAGIWNAVTTANTTPHGIYVRHDQLIVR